MSDNPLISALPVDRRRCADLLRSADAAPVLLDVRWTLAGSDRDGYLDGHIPGARVRRPGSGAGRRARCWRPASAAGRRPTCRRCWRRGRHRRRLDRDRLRRRQRAGGVPGLVAAALVGTAGRTGAGRWAAGLDSRTATGRTAAGPDGAAGPGTVTVRPGAMPVVDVDEAAELAGVRVRTAGRRRAGARFRGEIEPLDPVAGHIPGCGEPADRRAARRRRHLPVRATR